MIVTRASLEQDIATVARMHKAGAAPEFLADLCHQLIDQTADWVKVIRRKIPPDIMADLVAATRTATSGDVPATLVAIERAILGVLPSPRKRERLT